MKEYRSTNIYGNFYENQGKPLVVVIGGSRPGLPAPISENLMQYLTTNYNVLLLAYFGLSPLPESLEEISMEYFVHAIQEVMDECDISSNEVVIIGQSKGGEAALLLTQYIKSAATIALVASCYAFQGLPAHPNTTMLTNPKSSWSYKGKGLPYIKFYMDDTIIKEAKNQNFCRCYEMSIQKNWNKKAFINLNDYQGCVLLISEEDDPYWPSQEMSKLLIEKSNQSTKIQHVSMQLEGHYLLSYAQSVEKIESYLDKLFGTK